jgi:peptidyl-prolyl cis-trans isomerase SurA
MIDERILSSEVKKQNLSVPIERVEQEIRTIAKRNNVNRDELKAAIQDRGIPFSQYQDFIKTGLERQSLVEKAVTQHIKISEDDVVSAYATRSGNNQEQAFEYTLSHIYFRNDKGGAAQARARAEAALKKLREGVSFEKLASDVSEDPAFEQGGLLGVFKTGELQKDLEKSIVKLNPGEHTGVLPASGGFDIIRVNKKRIIADPRTEKDREKIRAELYEKAYKKQFQSWLDQLRQDTFIRINK